MVSKGKFDMKLIKIGLVAVMLFNTANVHAGWLNQGGKITQLYNTSNKNNIYATFGITVSGGSGSCSTILFPRSAAANADVHKRAFSMAMLAYTNEDSVSVYNYSGSSCDGASFIQVVK